MSHVYLGQAGHPAPSVAPSRRPSRVVEVLAGRDTWGVLRTGYARHATSYRLAIYPPDVDARDRLHLRVWYDCPIWALFLALGTWTAAAALNTGPILATVAMLVVTAAAVAWAAHTVAPIRRRVHWMNVWVADDDDLAGKAGEQQVKQIVAELRGVDSELRAGRISFTEYESTRSRAYWSLR